MLHVHNWTPYALSSQLTASHASTQSTPLSKWPVRIWKANPPDRRLDGLGFPTCKWRTLAVQFIPHTYNQTIAQSHEFVP